MLRGCKSKKWIDLKGGQFQDAVRKKLSKPMNLVHILKTTSSFGPHYLTWPSRGLKLQPTFIIRADWFSKSNILRLNLLSFSTTWSAVFWMLQRPALTLARSLLAEVRSFRIRWQLLSSRVTRTLNSPDSLSVTAKQSSVLYIPKHSEKLIDIEKLK